MTMPGSTSAARCVHQSNTGCGASPARRIAGRIRVCTVHAQCRSSNQRGSSGLSRREAGLGLASVALAIAATPVRPAAAAGFKKELKKRKLAPEDYNENDVVGLRTFELEEGRAGEEIKPGDRVVVHFDCLYRGLDVVSSRSARLLGGNRTIAEPYEFVAGERVLGAAVKKISEGANGLFAGAGGPTPPPALSRAVLGMRKGGKRSVLVDDPQQGFPLGQQEIPPGATFELKVEVLEVYRSSA